jgi:hypothetical protein
MPLRDAWGVLREPPDSPLDATTRKRACYMREDGCFAAGGCASDNE